MLFRSCLLTGVLRWQPLPAGPFWLFSGGFFGLVFIIAAAQIIKPLASLRFALGSVTGQLLGSLLLDVFAPTTGTDISAHLLTGIALTAIAVVLANLRPKPVIA